jgi:hypothetical protein
MLKPRWCLNPGLWYLSSAHFFPIFGLTAVLKILSFRALALGDNIADLLQLWHQQPVLKIITLAHSPACNYGSSAEMLRQSHWKTQIEGLTKRRFFPFSVSRARCAYEAQGGTSAMFLHNFLCLVPSMSSPLPQSKGSILQDPLPIEPTSLRGRAATSSRDRTPARSFSVRGLRRRQERFRARFFARCGCRRRTP